MADLAPEHLASLTMLASIGDQAKEGSGSYEFEHVKYALGFVVIGGVPTLIPHFGLLGTFTERTRLSAQLLGHRPAPPQGHYRGAFTIPTLIIHGREDVLVRADAAEEHHQLIKTSRLVILRANHFLPFMQAHETATCLVPFLARHDTPGVEPLTTTEDLSEVPRRKGLTGVVDHARAFIRAMAWWTQASAIAKVVLVAPTIGIVACAALVTTQDVDFMVAIVGIAIGLSLPNRAAADPGGDPRQEAVQDPPGRPKAGHRFRCSTGRGG